MNSRRSFIQLASLAAAGNLVGLRPFGMMNALAQSAGDYKALVCIFLFGGNDSNNMVVPFDTTNYAAYQKIRGPLALSRSSLLPLSSLPNYALHPSMPEVRSLINGGRAAIVSNVGTLQAPVTRAQVLSGQNLPQSLYSHVDQQVQWEGNSETGDNTGWGGRISDAISGSLDSGSRIPMITSVAGDTSFCDGVTSDRFAMDPGVLGTGACSAGSYCDERMAAAMQLLSLQSSSPLVNADNNITKLAYQYGSEVKSAITSANPIKTIFPSGNSLAAQLQQVAQMLSVRRTLGASRQIFFCGFGSFDTHYNQLSNQAALLTQLSQAMNSFYNATVELGVANQVTTFTMSEFGRVLEGNSSSGSDHAWGSHHLVMGGSVRSNLYGTFPELALGGPSDADTNGRWIPTISTAQYGSTLAEWFGVPTNKLSSVFPNIGNFSSKNLGFMG